MNKIKILPALFLSVTIPVLIVVSIISLRSGSANDVNTAEGASYLEALDKQDVRLVEHVLRGDGNVEPSGGDETAPAVEPVTGEEPVTKDNFETSYRPDETDSEPATMAPGFVGSTNKSYSPYGFDKKKAEKVAKGIENGTTSTASLFSDTLFVGDSIMVGFSDYRIADSGNVIAKVGASLNPHLSDSMQTIIDYNPEVLFLHYGLNEMSKDEYQLEKFNEVLRDNLKVLKDNLPYTKIVMVFLWPVKDIAIESQDRLDRVPAYNEVIRSACVDIGIAYYENSAIFTDNSDLYYKDGIHCDRSMYILWLCDLIREMGIY